MILFSASILSSNQFSSTKSVTISKCAACLSLSELCCGVVACPTESRGGRFVCGCRREEEEEEEKEEEEEEEGCFGSQC